MCAALKQHPYRFHASDRANGAIKPSPWPVCGVRREQHGPRDLRPGHGRDCREAGERPVHAGRDDLGEDQEPAVQPGGRARGLFRSLKGTRISWRRLALSGKLSGANRDVHGDERSDQSVLRSGPTFLMRPKE